MVTSPATERRGRLDRETVVLAAEALVDRDGYDALSMTSLAAELDSRVSSLYNHVGGLDDVRAEIQTRAMHLMGRQVQRAAMGRTGADGLAALCHELRRFALDYPRRYAAMTHRAIEPDSLLEAAGEVIEAVGVMVRSTGLGGDRVIPTGMAIFSAIHGFVSLEAIGYFDGIDGLEAVYEQVVRGAVTSAVLEVTTPR
ncbi:TetR/AcrR family transcriptional regulator [Nocardioides sp. R-C-SC26]|uniref:TetR/AcrR family transcriptional regulator n=1 Tax=Nocardioides sp. R-C-SC26 TaxID=2870414 RepID=UPI001E395E66|nr:TetR-like C-terminal domain-containing protein [Nocardioides sp. R-C-SC26]